jgi:hypothetical protein
MSVGCGAVRGRQGGGAEVVTAAIARRSPKASAEALAQTGRVRACLNVAWAALRSEDSVHRAKFVLQELRLELGSGVSFVGVTAFSNRWKLRLEICDLGDRDWVEEAICALRMKARSGDCLVRRLDSREGRTVRSFVAFKEADD